MLEMKKMVVSACLGFENCRYDGKMSRTRIAARSGQKIIFLPVCPEASIGLGVPRKKLRLVNSAGGARLIQPHTGADLTGKMRNFTRRFIRSAGKIDGFILKKRSPSCGMGDVKMYSSAASRKPLASRGTGLFAAESIRLCPKASFNGC